MNRLRLSEARKFALMCDSYARLERILDFAPRMERRDWLRLLGDFWSVCDNIGKYRQQLRRLLPTAGPADDLMNAAERATYEALPQSVRVYRGCGPDNMVGASWSLDRAVAERFPYLLRYFTEAPLLLSGTVPKHRILAVKLDRDEVEVPTFHVRRNSVERLPVRSLLSTFEAA